VAVLADETLPAISTRSGAFLHDDEISEWIDGLGDLHAFAGFADLCDTIMAAGRLDPPYALVVALQWAGDETVHGWPRRHVPTGTTPRALKNARNSRRRPCGSRRVLAA
jgi:hypothetical protein